MSSRPGSPQFDGVVGKGMDLPDAFTDDVVPELQGLGESLAAYDHVEGGGRGGRSDQLLQRPPGALLPRKRKIRGGRASSPIHLSPQSSPRHDVRTLSPVHDESAIAEGLRQSFAIRHLAEVAKLDELDAAPRRFLEEADGDAAHENEHGASATESSAGSCSDTDQEESDGASRRASDTTCCASCLTRFGRCLRSQVWLLSPPAPSSRRHPAMCRKALGCISPHLRFRIVAYNLVTRSMLFEVFMILLILANSLVLVFDGTGKETDLRNRPAYSLGLEAFFAIAFTAEMALKIIALGFVRHRGAYLRDGWNILDFLLVVLSYLVFIPGMDNITVFRILRVVRPLRSINAIPGLKLLATAIFRSFSKLKYAAVLGLLLVTLFGVPAVQLWGGTFRLRCVQYFPMDGAPLPDTHPRDVKMHNGSVVQLRRHVYERMFCSTKRSAAVLSVDDVEQLPLRPLLEDKTSAVSLTLMGSLCPSGTFCEAHHNPQCGYLSFDDLALAFTIIVKVATLDGWTEAYYIAMHSFSAPIGFILFFSVITACGFIMPNLALAIMTEAFSSAVRVDEHRRSRMSAARSKCGEADASSHLGATALQMSADEKGARVSDFVPVSLLLRNAIHVLLFNAPLHDFALAVHSRCSAQQLRRSALKSRWFEKTIPYDCARSEDEDDFEKVLAASRSEFESFFHDRPHLRPFLHRYAIAVVVLCIMGNIAALCSKHHRQAQWVGEVISWLNLLFICVFCIEMVVTIFAVGPRWFFKDAFFILDVIVTAASVVEFAVTGISPLSALRGFRLLRVAKTLRSAPSLWIITQVLISCLSHTFYLILILMLVLFVAALIGMQLFPGMRSLETSPISPLSMDDLRIHGNLSEVASDYVLASRMPVTVRAHFDDFWSAFLTVFRVVAREGWAGIMYQAMATSPESPVFAGIFFILLVLVGNLVLLNLFLAVLILGFQAHEKLVEEHDDHAEMRVVMDAELREAIAEEAEAEEEATILVGSFYGAKHRRRAPIRQQPSAHHLSRFSTASIAGTELMSEGATVVAFSPTVPAKKGRRPAAAGNTEVGNPLSPPHSHSNEAHHKEETEMERLGIVHFADVPVCPCDEDDDQSTSLDDSDGAESSNGSDAGGDCNSDDGTTANRRVAPREVQRFLGTPLLQRIALIDSGKYIHEANSALSESTMRLQLIAGLFNNRGGNTAATSHSAVLTSPATVARRERAHFGFTSTTLTQSDAFCATCKCEIDEILPAPPLANYRGALAFHYKQGRCARAEVQRRRSDLLAQLRDYASVMAYFHSLPASSRLEQRNHFRSALGAENVAEIASVLQAPDIQLDVAFLHQLYDQLERLEEQEPIGKHDSERSEMPLSPHQPTHSVHDEENHWISMRELLELKRIMVVDGFRNGQEQIGGGAIRAATGSLPVPHMTNGGVSLGLFGPRNRFRVAVSSMVNHPSFEYFSAALIAVSTIFLAMDNPRHSPGTFTVLVDVVNTMFTCVFFTEIILRMVAKGVYHSSKTAFLRDPWGRLDVVIVSISTIILILAPPSLSTSVSSDAAASWAPIGKDAISVLRSLKALRALRLLRLVSRNRSLKMVVATLVRSAQGIIDMMLICTLFFIVVGALCIHWFAGEFYSCNDPLITTRTECVGSVVNDRGVVFERRWVNADSHFDNIGAAIVALVESAAGMWSTTLYNLIDAYAVDQAPKRDSNAAAGVFYVLFFALSNFFMLKMFIALVIFNFHRVKNKIDGFGLMTDEQRLWVEAQRLMLDFRPVVKLLPPSDLGKLQKDMNVGQMKAAAISDAHVATAFWGGFRNDARRAKAMREDTIGHAMMRVIERTRDLVFRIVTSSGFEVVISVTILFNIIVLATVHYDQDREWTMMQLVLNSVFNAIFAIEMLLKLYGCGASQYFSVAWNRFDAFIVLVTAIDVSLLISGSHDIPVDFTILKLLRILRVLRVLRLVKGASNLRTLIETIYFALPSLINIYAFMFLIFFMYAIAGVQLFANIDEPVEFASVHGKSWIFSGVDNAYQNFHNIGNAFMLLFTFTANESWNSVMHSCTMQPPECGIEFVRNITDANGTVVGQEMDLDDSNCGYWFAPLFFISFLFISGFVVSNLFVEVILSQFSTTLRLEKHSALKLHRLHQFVEVWSHLDPGASMLVSANAFPEIVGNIAAHTHNGSAFQASTVPGQCTAESEVVTAKQHLMSPASPLAAPLRRLYQLKNEEDYAPRVESDGGIVSSENVSRGLTVDAIGDSEASPLLGFKFRGRQAAHYHELPSHMRILALAKHYNISEHAGKIHFVETLIPLARLMMAVDIPEYDVRMHQEMWRQLFPKLFDLPVVRLRGRPTTLVHHFASAYIASWYRGVNTRKRGTRVAKI